MARLSLENLTKTYPDGFTAVRDLNLEVEDGSFVVLVGPSGCGKTTTLRMIAGLETVTSGKIRIGDRVVNDVHPKDRDIAMVFQNYALYPHMSVADNLGFALRMRRVPRDERDRRVAEAAELLGISSILNKKPGSLSGGQRQRVALGRAIVRKPAVFLFDEPLSNLDPDRRVATRSEIRRIQRTLGTTTVYVTHDHEEAMALSDTVVVLNEGVLQQAGAPEQVYSQPANLFVGRFLGSPRMNAIVAQVEVSGTDIWARVSNQGREIRLPLDRGALPEGVDSGSRVTLGVRPHDIELKAPGDQDSASMLEGVVIDVEPLGFASDVTVDLGDQEVQIRAHSSGQSFRVKDKVGLSFAKADTRVFLG